jgi:hypothetical protein
VLKLSPLNKKKCRRFTQEQAKLMVQFLIDIERVMNHETHKIPETRKEIGNYNTKKSKQIAYRRKRLILSAGMFSSRFLSPDLNDSLASF